jgi:hypothetical protein
MKGPRGFQKRGRLLVVMAILISASISACGQGAAVSSAGTPSPTALASPIASPTPNLLAQLPNPCSLLSTAQVASAIGTPTANDGIKSISGLRWIGGTRCLWRGQGVPQCLSGVCILEDDLKLDSSIEAAQSDFQTVLLAAGKTFGCSPSPLAGLGDEAETCTPSNRVTHIALPQIILLARKANVLVACAIVAPSASSILNRALTAAQVIAAGI